MNKWGKLLVVVCGLALAACGGKGQTGELDTSSELPDVTEVVPTDVGTEPDSEHGLDICVPMCDGRDCGDDGCGGSCGQCCPGAGCSYGRCMCAPYCTGKECGFDGCCGSCGDCPEGQSCDGEGQCLKDCEPDCDGKMCGDDGCGENCGLCPCDNCPPEAEECVDGQCVEPEYCDCACMFECFEGCPEGDQACYQECVNNGPQAPGYNNFITCLDQSGYFDCAQDDEECSNEALKLCLYQVYGCYLVEGDLECVDMYLCLLDCIITGDEDNVCAKKCFAGGTVGANITWSIFIYCLSENGYFDCPENDQVCYDTAWEECEAEFKECAHGELSCSDMFECMADCEEDDELCGQSCLVHGSLSAQETYEILQVCLESECGEEPDADCLASAVAGACAGDQAACLGCQPDCTGKECGDDGCGGSCGECTKFCCDKCTGTGHCYVYALPCLPGEGDCTGKECGDDGCGNSCGFCSAGKECKDGQCELLPALTFVSPTSNHYFDQAESETPIPVEFEIKGWSLYPSSDKGIVCLLDGDDVGSSDTTSFVFPDVLLGMHTLTCRLALDSMPLSNCEATASVIVKVKKPCVQGDDAACNDGNPCSVDSCISVGPSELECRYGLDLFNPECCLSGFDCNCTNNGASVGTWEVCSEQYSTCGDCGTPGDDPLCDDDNDCTTDSCVEVDSNLDCVHAWIYYPEGKCCSDQLVNPDAACEDGMIMTVDKCNLAAGYCENAGGPCYEDPDSGCNDDDQCTVDSCEHSIFDHWYCSHFLTDWCSM